MLEKYFGYAVSLVTIIVGIATAFALNRFKVDQVAKETKENKDTLNILIRDLHGITIQLATISKEQATINVTVAKALEAVVDRLEKLTVKVNDHGEALAVLKDRADG